jgi:hypothetical protein
MAKNFQIPAITAHLDRGGYAKELTGHTIHVWLNPPRKLRAQIDECHAQIALLTNKLFALGKSLVELQKDIDTIKDEKKREKITSQKNDTEQKVQEIAKEREDNFDMLPGLFSQVWSKGEDPESYWSVSEIKTMIDSTKESDPMLWVWLRDNTVRMIAEHRTQLKKK